MPCRRKPQFRRGRLGRCVCAMSLLRAGSDRPTAEIFDELAVREPGLAVSVGRNTLHCLERRGYVAGETFELFHVPGGRQRRWSLTELGARVLDRFEQIHQREEREAA